MNSVKEILKDFINLPRFEDGRIDYSESSIAPVVVCFVKSGGEILMLKRSEKVRTYQGKWQTVAGYIDELKPLRSKVLEELSEEIGLKFDQIESLKLGKVFRYEDKDIGKIWIVHPALVMVNKKPQIKLDFEHTDFRWISPEKLANLDIVPNAIRSWEAARGL